MFDPSGTTSDKKLATAIAFPLNNRTVVSNEAKDYRHEQCVHHLTYKALRHLPKFNDELDDDNHEEYRPSQHSFQSQQRQIDNQRVEDDEKQDEEEDERSSYRSTQNRSAIATPTEFLQPAKCKAVRTPLISWIKSKPDHMKQQHKKIALRKSCVDSCFHETEYGAHGGTECAPRLFNRWLHHGRRQSRPPWVHKAHKESES